MGPIAAIFNADSIICFSNNTIRGNSRAHCVLECSSFDSLYIINNTLVNNSTPFNIICSSPALLVESNVIDDNYGTGIYCFESSGIIKSNVISSNNIGYGGAIFFHSSSIKAINNTITNNQMDYAFGIRVDASSYSVVSNNIVCNNELPGHCDKYCKAGGIYAEDSTITIICNNVYNNDGGNYKGIPDQTGINGNISFDPIFCDPENDDYSLHVQSPCLPGNHPDGVDCGLIGALAEGCDYIATQLQGYQATVKESFVIIEWIMSDYHDNTGFDIFRRVLPDGKYMVLKDTVIRGGGLSFSFHDSDCERSCTYKYRIDVEDKHGRRLLFETDPITIPTIPLTLYQNYPNPFNPATSIRYYLPEKSWVSLVIYDVSGKLITTLVNRAQEKGAHAVHWSGTDQHGNSVASGVYVYRLTAGKETISKKMILMR